MSEYNSQNSYNDQMRAECYAWSKGFGFERKVRMYEVTLDLLTTLTTSQSTVLELGCGTGLFTEKMLFAKQLSRDLRNRWLRCNVVEQLALSAR